MRRYFATCAAGLEPVLAAELQQLGATHIQPGRGGVQFCGDRLLLYAANLWLRSAIRVLEPILEAEVDSYEALYAAVRQVDWRDYLNVEQTLAVDAHVRDSPLTHSQYAARRVKDAICDQFRERLGRRPSVDPDRPMLGLNLHVRGRQVILSRDSSWVSLHKRGYRPIQTRAPLNEALAAGLLLHLRWQGETPLVDLMCGSGTVCIEGAWLALHRAPGLTRKWFGFQGWLDFDKATWAMLRSEARRRLRPRLPFPIWGSDCHSPSVALAVRNAHMAGVGSLLHFYVRDLRASRPPAHLPPGLILCNPPYGERLDVDPGQIRSLYAALGQTVQRHWPGWRLAVFAAGSTWLSSIGLPVVRTWSLYNGPIRCTLAEFAPAGKNN
ncbi:MAG: THUMP domain-containing protein [Thermogemmata sp.]|nr:THUMP domain-containing protein [Thermogemmata sp.]